MAVCPLLRVYRGAFCSRASVTLRSTANRASLSEPYHQPPSIGIAHLRGHRESFFGELIKSEGLSMRRRRNRLLKRRVQTIRRATVARMLYDGGRREQRD